MITLVAAVWLIFAVPFALHASEPLHEDDPVNAAGFLVALVWPIVAVAGMMFMGILFAVVGLSEAERRLGAWWASDWSRR